MKIGGKDAIIEAATGLIAFSGIDRLTMQTLSEELGISKASIYHWFPSKEGILEEVFEHGHRKLMEKGFRLELEGDAESVLRKAAERWSRIFSDDGLLPYLRTVFSLRYTDIRAEEEARALTLMIRSQVDVIMASLGESNAFLSSLFSALMMQHLEAVLRGEDADIVGEAAAFASLITSHIDSR